MPQLESIVAVTIAGFALSATPGPSMLYVLSRTMAQGRSAGIASALGLALGGIILAVATAVGVATLFDKFDWLVPALQYLGSVYLIWLGVGIIKSAHNGAETENISKLTLVEQKPIATIIWQGMLVELLNPKTVLFFGLFLPPFVTGAGDMATEGSVKLQLLTLGILVPLTAIPSDMMVAFLGGSISDVVNRQQNVRAGLSWSAGLTLIIIALNLHLAII